MVMNVLSLFGPLLDLKSIGHPRLFIMGSVVMFIVYKLNVKLMSRLVLNSNGELKTEFTGQGWRQMAGHMYLVGSMVILAVAHFFIAKSA